MAENLQERLYQRLREDLLAGRFQPGERLKIRDLANQWGTSPMPVRAALQRLVAEGALEGEAQRSLRVPLMTRERFLQILQVRLSLEGLAAEKRQRPAGRAGTGRTRRLSAANGGRLAPTRGTGLPGSQ